ncbi:MAG: hypothetical protein PPP56_09175 [Longimonas sp.]
MGLLYQWLVSELEHFGGRNAVRQVHRVNADMPDALTDLSFKAKVDKDSL